MIDLEHAQARVGIAIGEGVEAGAEHDQLANAAAYRKGERVLGETTASGDKEPHGPPVRMGESVSGNSLRTLAQDLDRQTIVKDAPMVE